MAHHSILFDVRKSYTVQFVTIAQSVSSKYQSLFSMVKEFHYNFIMLPNTKHKF